VWCLANGFNCFNRGGWGLVGRTARTAQEGDTAICTVGHWGVSLNVFRIRYDEKSLSSQCGGFNGWEGWTVFVPQLDRRFWLMYVQVGCVIVRLYWQTVGFEGAYMYAM
jgi:hypothetical protein